MSPTRRFPARLIRWTSMFLCIALLFSAIAGIPFQTASSKESSRVRPQEQDTNERRVTPVPPRTGPPAPNLPNLDEVKHRQVQAPRAAAAIPSTIRSRRKPLESRNGRRVGDPLPPRVRPTPLATPSGLPTPTATPTPRSEEFASILRNRPTMLLASILLRPEPFGFFPFVTTSPDLSWLPLSDSSATLFMFDVTAPPIPQAGGSKIVFASSRDGCMQIYVMNSDGTGQARLTTDGSNNENPRWSPDGTKILFQSDRDNPGSPDSSGRDIYVMNSNGSGQTRLTTDANDDCFASWSSDGTKIVFQSFRNGVSYQIYTMNADGSSPLNVSNNAVNDTRPSWSAAGKIAFASDRDQPAYPSIYWMNSNGTSQTRLTFSGTGLRDEQPVWSPNGTKLTFTSTRDSVLESWQETDDYEIPEDDGQVFNRSKLKINKEVYVMNADGSGQTRLTFALENDDSPCWSPDGAKIVFRSERERPDPSGFDPTPQIWTMNADGTNQTNLSNSGDGDSSPSWTSSSANQWPVANAGGPYSGVVGQNAPFNGNGSYDPDGSIVSYAWTFGDGGTGSGVSPTHAYGATGTYNVTLTVTDNLGAQAIASSTISVSASTSDQYVTSFLQLGLGRAPTGQESTYWTDIMRAAYPQGLPSMKLAMRELGVTVFESSEYAGRNRNDHWYVYDLYKTFLMREPDTEGWANWEAAIPIYGRDQIRRGFDESTEFANIVATLNASGSPSAAVSSLATARVDPFNQSGNQLRARDAEWSVSLVSLPGRAGLDLGLGLSYSSLVWTNSGPYMYFDADGGSPSPGFHIGFPTIQDKYFDARVGRNVYLLKTAAGRRVELRQVGTSNVYESADSSYLQLTAGGSLLLRTTDGTSLTFSGTGLNEYRCTSILDRNGNYMAVNYDWRGDIQNVTDTLGRVITFNYDTNLNLNSITQTWNGVAHTWASFGWENLTMQPTVNGIVGTYNSEVMPVLKMVAVHDGTYTKFLYNGNGQVERVTQYASDSNPLTDNHPRSYTDFDYDSATSDSPRLISTRTWAEYWTGLNGVPTEVTTYFGVDGDVRVLTAPDGTVYKERYAAVPPAPAWQRGLVLQSEVWSSGVQQKLSTIAWTQDNTSVNYKTNPRVIETNVYDSSGNRRRVTIDCGPYAQWGLPYLVKEYAADGLTEIRHTFTDYNLSQHYLDRRIIGLVSNVHLSNVAEWQMRISYGYDDPSRITSQATTATMHDQTYDASFTIRGNVTSVSRWDVTDINNASKAITTQVSYNAAGSVLSTTDPAGHSNAVSYADLFSDGNNSRNTFAYPTTLTDADGFSSTIRYNFDFGAKTRVEGPPPQNQPNGVIQTMLYDDAGRVKRVTSQNNGAYTHYEYGPNYVQSYSSVNTVAANYLESDLYSITVLDGVGRAFTTTSNHPGSAGGYKLVNVIFDKMGRPFLQSNPTEVNSSWLPAGDDAYNPATGEGGVRYSVLDFDWQGRTARKTHPDGAYTEASYAGCGCAGGEVVTLTDERNRQQKVYSDVLGRTWKTEVLTWPDGGGNRSVYSSGVSVFNARDQVQIVNQYAGSAPAEASSTNTEVSCQTGTCQKTSTTFDGYGRLQSKHVPEQNAGTATVYAYNPDDTIQSVTDARGASATYGYNNNRRLVTSIDFTAPYGVTETPDVTFGYDAAGNRTSMTDGLGGVSYSFDSLSRLASETRTFNGVGSFTLSYGYNLAGELNSITDPFGGTLTYGRDALGRVNSVNGTGYGEVSQFATNIQYRAWGGLKGITYNSSRSMSMNYNSRMLPTLYQFFGQSQTAGTEYQYYGDGRISYARDLNEPIFDRSYGYDHVERLTQAFSGSEARGGATPDGPYRQTYSFDTFDNLTTRTGRDWSHNSPAVSFNYDPATNRNPQWQYDADGRVTVQGNRSYSYNAAGKQTRASEGSVSINHDFDGDGFKVSQNSFDYYLRSTALNGEIVAELNTQGQFRNRYVYANGKLLARQYDTGWVAWTHSSPSNNTEWRSFGTGVFRDAEYDPVGTNFGLEDPYLDPGSGGGYGDWSGGGGIPTDLTTGCSWEGMAIGCQYAIKFTGWRGYIAGGLSITSRTIPGVGMPWSQTTHVRSRVVGLTDWSEGEITRFHNFVATPDTTQTEIVRTHHVRVQKKQPCTFNINLKNRSNVALGKKDLAAIEEALNAAFATAGYRGTLNNPSAASHPTLNYELTVYNNFPASYPINVRRDSTTIGYTRLTRQIPDSDYPGIYFPGPTGGVSVSHIRASYGARYGRPAALAPLIGWIGAHEMIAHYLLMEPGHPEDYNTGITAEALGDPTKLDRSIPDSVKKLLDEICRSGQLPK